MEKKHTIKPVPWSTTAYKLTVDGTDVACVSTVNIGSTPGIYWFNLNQDKMTRPEAQKLFDAWFAEANGCRHCADGDCMNCESAHFDWPCVRCGQFAPRAKEVAHA